jgi:4-hydroxy-2-oxoheptanedioate aldolase
MNSNPVREKLGRGEAAIGTWSSTGDPSVIELLARTGLDWLTVDFEHNPIDVSTAINCLRGMMGTECVPFARVPSNDPIWTKRVLDIGFLGVVVPDVRSPEEVERAVKGARYRPAGERGIGSTRGSLIYGGDYYQKANDLTMVVCMIEHPDAVRQIDDIMRVPGLDVAFIGPNDLASSMGVPIGLDNKHPDHMAAVAKVLAAGRRHGVAAGIHCIDGAEVARRIEQGFQWMPIASDSRVLRWGMEFQLKDAKAKGVKASGGSMKGPASATATAPAGATRDGKKDASGKAFY